MRRWAIRMDRQLGTIHTGQDYQEELEWNGAKEVNRWDQVTGKKTQRFLGEPGCDNINLAILSVSKECILSVQPWAVMEEG